MALRHTKEAELLPAPAVIGEAVILRDQLPAAAIRPCTFRSAAHLIQLAGTKTQRRLMSAPHLKVFLVDCDHLTLNPSNPAPSVRYCADAETISFFCLVSFVVYSSVPWTRDAS